ncbi:alpha/beta hydrolase [Dactylosporangium sp. NPDC049140]|jgi:pimeloyl-ACP methyl ester carboxylesterase|uniref:alpha/beta fold hydrolase n=1 Tax=Dactylosporangium sp. NPDC049140 TaxID=3155647 RepID=UPI0033C80859
MTTTFDILGGRISLRVQRFGEGEPLLYIHPEGGLAPRDPLLTHLAERYTVFAPEFPGTTPGDPYAIHALDGWTDVVLAYEEVTRRLGLERPVVVGQSFGGMLAADLAAHFPALPSRLVLVAPVGLWHDDHPVRNWTTVAPDKTAGMLFHDPAGDAAKAALTLPTDPDQMRAVLLARVWSMACTGRFAWPFPDHGLRGRLHRVAAPTLLVWGRDDRIVDAAYAKEFTAGIASSSATVIDECGHVPQVEQYRQTAAAVDAFLA